ncbi:MAG: hypothetical protein ABIG61_13430 [Planctomycetota bacterium]
MNPAIEHFEKILDKVILRPNSFYGAEKYTNFLHKDCLHSFTQALGTPAQRYCCFCGNAVQADFVLPGFVNSENRKSRFLLKLIATWENWKLYSHPVRIMLNGKELFNDELFLENVCKGWPGLYFGVPLEYLDKAANHIEIINGSSGANNLLIERIEILKQTDIRDFSVFFCPEIVIQGEIIEIKLSLLRKYPEIKVVCPERILKFQGRRNESFLFKPLKPARNVRITFSSKGKKCTAVIDEIFAKTGTDKLYVGIDFDDCRHDESEEPDRILAHFAYTQMGNLIAFRPKANRNYPANFPASPASWKRWINFCKAHNIYLQLSGLPNTSAGKKISCPNDKRLVGFRPDTLAKKEIVRACGRNLVGFQIHEPYCWCFSPVLRNPPAIAQARNFSAKKKAYLQYVDSQVKEMKFGRSKALCGDPSLLCVYLREAKIDTILCETVSNCALLYGAARGTGKDFGAHIPIDWYGGFPHDQHAVKRFSLLLDLVYAYGGKHIYVESTAFKTNAFARNDWEDPFCRSIRTVLRQFYRFTRADTRIGKPDIPLAFIYGNLESMFWRPDDRIPELADSGNWDDVVWGKWSNTEYRRLWKASEAWLPLLQFEQLGKNESLTNVFCGTPYGPVDVVSPYCDLSNYKAVAFLGWNTMDQTIYANLLKYVNNGGIVFICGCHFDTRVDFSGKARFLNNGRVSSLIGADIAGKDRKVFERFHTCRLENVTAKQTEAFLFENQIGKGKVYFFNFYDYPYDFRLVEKIENILVRIGRDVRNTNEIAIEGPNSDYINYNVWKKGGKRKLYLVNIDWQNQSGRKITVRFRDRKRIVSIPGGWMVSLEM